MDRDGIGVDRSEQRLLAVAEQVRPGPHLVHPARRGAEHRRGRSGAHDRHLEAGRLDRVGGGGEGPHLVVGRAEARRGALVAVAAVAEDALDHEAELGGGPGDVCRPLRWHARPLVAGIDLDPDPQRPVGASHGRREPFRAGHGVEPDGEVRGVVDGPQPGGLRPDGPDRIGKEEVREAGSGEDLGLTERADRQPDRAGLELDPAEGDALVGLDVRPEADAPRIERRLEPAGVRLDDLEVEEERRGVEAVRDRRAGEMQAGHAGRATIGVRSSPSRSIARVTVSPGSRYRPRVASFISRRQPEPTVPLPTRSPGRSRTSAEARASIAPKLNCASAHVPWLMACRVPVASVTAAVIARAGPVAPGARASASSSGVTIHGPIVVAKSLPLAGPSRTVVSSRWRSRADQSSRMQ